jgi:hypothetical protein
MKIHPQPSDFKQKQGNGEGNGHEPRRGYKHKSEIYVRLRFELKKRIKVLKRQACADGRYNGLV